MFRRYAVVRQHDQSDCGAAALAAVARQYRMPLSVQRLRELAGTDQQGTNLLGLMQAAEAIGFSVRAVKGDGFQSLREAPLPAIAHTVNDEGQGHYLVLHKVTRRKAIVADPAGGIVSYGKDEFAARWTGYLLLLTPETAGLKAAEDIRQQSPFRRFLGLLSGHAAVLFEACLCAILLALLGVSTSYFVQHLVDSVLVRSDSGLLNALGIGMLLVLTFRMGFGVVRQYLLAHVGRKIDLALMSAYARRLLTLPMSFFEMRRVGEILSRFNDASRIREAIGGAALTAMVDGVLVTLLVAVLWMYDAQLAAVATAFVPLLMLTIVIHHPAAKRRSREIMEQAAHHSAHIAEDVSGIETIKAFGLERRRAEQGEDRLVKVVGANFGMEKLGISLTAIGTIVTGAAGVTILWFGGHRVMAGALTIGELMFFYTLLGYLLQPLERLASLNVVLQEALVAVDRLYQVLDLDPEPVGDGKVPFTGVRRAIELKNVDFQYGSRSKVLHDVSLTIPAGKTVAVVGESGSGKSTLLKLLMSSYQPTGGRILADGVDLRDIELASLRERIGVVSQEPFIFNATLRENIALGRPGATLAEVVEAARAAGLDEFIASLPQRYETPIGERGANLSGGQRQRLAIARALLRQPDVLIFDEATSHLDTATERAIQENLETALAGRTVVLVAHRLSTIRTADLIYVMHDGRIVEQGTHAELIAAGGRYAALWQAQTVGAGRTHLVTPAAPPGNSGPDYPIAAAGPTAPPEAASSRAPRDHAADPRSGAAVRTIFPGVS